MKLRRTKQNVPVFWATLYVHHGPWLLKEVSGEGVCTRSEIWSGVCRLRIRIDET